MGYSGNMYAQATEVITSQGDLRRGDSSGNPERLAIGSSGKVLQSNGTTESWETLSLADTVLTTQGDILYEGASALARLGQSTANYTLATKGSSANPAWQASATSVMSGAQDILYSSAANTLARLAAGTDGDLLTTHGTGSAPTWETPAASGGTITRVFTQELTGAASVITYTPSPALQGEDYAAVLVFASLEFSDSSSDTRLEVSNDTTGYYTDGSQWAGGASTVIDEGNQTTAFINGVASDMTAVQIMIQTGNPNLSGNMTFTSYSSHADSSTFVGGMNSTGGIDEISEIELQTTAGDFKIGSSMSVYTVDRV